jgi:hypothetical protein
MIFHQHTVLSPNLSLFIVNVLFDDRPLSLLVDLRCQERPHLLLILFILMHSLHFKQSAFHLTFQLKLPQSFLFLLLLVGLGLQNRISHSHHVSLCSLFSSLKLSHSVFLLLAKHLNVVSLSRSVVIPFLYCLVFLNLLHLFVFIQHSMQIVFLLFFLFHQQVPFILHLDSQLQHLRSLRCQLLSAL